MAKPRSTDLIGASFRILQNQVVPHTQLQNSLTSMVPPGPPPCHRITDGNKLQTIAI